MYVAAKQSFRFQETTGRLQEDATFALDSMARDLRMAGSAGCVGINKVTSPSIIYYPGSVLASGSPTSPGVTTSPDNTSGFYGANPLGQIETTNLEVTQQPFTSLNFVRGFDNGIPTGMVATTNPAPSTISDSLLFAGASSKGVSVSVPMAAANSNLTLAADTYGWSNAVSGTNSGIYTFIVSDCSSSSIFNGKITVSSGVISIDHSTAMGNSVGSFTSSMLFGTDAIVMPAEWSFYYIATRTGASTPSLYRVFFNGNKRFNAEELVSNVEAMQLNYGENTTDVAGVPTLVADVWRTSAATVTDWSRVVSVRIGLMMVSSEDNANPEVTLTVPTLLGQTYTAPTGASANRLRKEFSTTVVMRNRVAAR
ncbi:PilW family protein [Polaromonas sp. UBA4122]|uniref:PilW family protein n=1 Tax=Polaromonas sp. UBA4122 TaxID=1947074 RepID=UPI0025F7B09C|nr:PilW family protein [Polaromonas sp. UBA4122]